MILAENQFDGAWMIFGPLLYFLCSVHACHYEYIILHVHGQIGVNPQKIARLVSVRHVPQPHVCLL